MPILNDNYHVDTCEININRSDINRSKSVLRFLLACMKKQQRVLSGYHDEFPMIINIRHMANHKNETMRKFRPRLRKKTISNCTNDYQTYYATYKKITLKKAIDNPFSHPLCKQMTLRQYSRVISVQHQEGRLVF